MICFRCGRKLKTGQDYGGRMLGPTCYRRMVEPERRVRVEAASGHEGQLELFYAHSTIDGDCVGGKMGNDLELTT